MKIEEWQKIEELLNRALELEPAGREAFLDEISADSPELRGEVESLLAAESNVENFLAAPAIRLSGDFFVAPPDAFLGKQIGNYRVVGELGRGGMGAVYLATRADGEFEQQVAVKIIRQTLADASLVRYFKREREILASLNHPFIARLIDGGVGEDGAPFLAMEYVEGVPVTEFAETQNLNVEEKLGLFLKICNGVAYAHRNLIVHRDIKPSNIFVTADGTPKLLDFGLAKILETNAAGAESLQTETALQPMTPAYASPEQLRGEPITTASDIYSLGIVLYELLTNQRPYYFKSNKIEEIIRNVNESEPPRPSSVVSGHHTNGRAATDYDQAQTTNNEQRTNPKFKTQNLKSLAGDIDNIVLKALRKEPARRYQSIEQFSDDIERHLKGLPVKARPNTFSYRAEKFINRHKLGAAAAALILLTLIGGGAATVWQWQRAEQQRARAEKRFDDVRKLSHSLMFEIHDSVKDLPGATATRQLIVSRALEYLDSLAREPGDDAGLQRELATAYEKIGDIQGNPYLSNLGDSTGALESYHRSLAVRESLAAADPNNVDIKRELTSSYDHIGDVLGRTGDRKGAAEIIQKSIEIRRKLITENSDDNNLRRELATSQMKIGEHLQSSGDIDGGLENERQALATFESLAAQDPQDMKILRSVMVTDNKIGYILNIKGDLPGALESCRKGLVIARKLAAKDANNAPGQRDLSFAFNNVGRILLKQKDAAGARESFASSLEISQKLAAVDPKNALAKSDTAYALVRLGSAQAAAGQYREAIESQQKALAINQTLLAEDPKSMLARSEIGDGYQLIGDALEKIGDKNGALENYQKAAAVREEMSAKDPSDAQFSQSVAETYRTIGKLHAALGESKISNAARISERSEARLWLERSLEIWRQLNSSGKLSATDAENIAAIENELVKYFAPLNLENAVSKRGSVRKASR